MKKALALFSGGLDSLLAAKIILEQGVHVEAINFFTGFTGDTSPAVQSKIPAKLISHACARSVQQLGIKLHIVDIVDAFKPVLMCPKYGYGANLNPCLDCKLFMINCAKKAMLEMGFDFLISGEVLGQRPMSQRRDTLPLGAKDSGDLLLRPLSAKLLAPTLVEQNGWVQRDALYAISGRGRTSQMELAQHFGLKNYPQPAGGCVLTDNNYGIRLTAICHLGCGGEGGELELGRKCKWQQDYALDDIMLARLGRHLYVAPNLMLIVGRDEEDNAALEYYQRSYPTMTTEDFPGATVLLRGGVNDAANVALAARVTARFSQGKNQERVKVRLQYPDSAAVQRHAILEVAPLPASEMREEWYR